MESLAVKYRPQRWEDIAEQTSIIKILTRQLETNNIRNAYLFCGPSGTGKTTSGRIFAKAINNGQGNPIEIDAASNNTVDNIRIIVQQARERSIDSKYKIFIVDEVHTLSNQAWQAFLKCLEEPPEYTIFILCTTDPQKIPATILNRVQRFNLTKISTLGIIKRLKYICEQEHFTNYEQSVEYISKIANGGMRDAIAALEKASDFSHDLNINNVLEALGGYSYQDMFNLLNALIDCDEKTMLSLIDNYFNNGQDLKLFINQFISFLLDVAKYNIFKSFDVITIPKSLEVELNRVINIENAAAYFQYLLDKILNIRESIKNDINLKTTIEVMLLQLVRY